MLADVPDPVSWENFKWALGIIGTVFAAVIGWILRTQSTAEECDDHLQGQIARNETRIAVVEAHHEAVARDIAEIKEDGKERTKLLQELLRRRGQ